MLSQRSHLVAMALAASAVAFFVIAASEPPDTTPAQPSPQGNTGPLSTGAGGTPPNSPQGETPPNMQAKSPGAADAPKGK
jgi:hypothetical protein